MVETDGDTGLEPEIATEEPEPELTPNYPLEAGEIDAAGTALGKSEEAVGRITVEEHLAAVKAQHAAELEAAILREQLKRLEVEKQLAQLQARSPENSAGHTAGTAGSEGSTSSKSTDGGSRAERRRREKEWDRLSYIPVSNYEGNPFRGPDPSVHLGNRDRPQPFRLDHDPVYKELKRQKNSMRYEYEIHAPILYYYWGITKFVETDFEEVILGDSTPEQRVPYVEALQNSLKRTLEWFAIRHALITERARALAEGETNSPLIQHLQEEVYAFVGAAPPTSTWLDEIHTTFRDKVSVAQLKALANAQAKPSRSTGGSQSGGSGGVGASKRGAKGRGAPFTPLSDAGKSKDGK
jgi:hypothetical protein